MRLQIVSGFQYIELNHIVPLPFDIDQTFFFNSFNNSFVKVIKKISLNVSQKSEYFDPFEKSAEQINQNNFSGKKKLKL